MGVWLEKMRDDDLSSAGLTMTSQMLGQCIANNHICLLVSIYEVHSFIPRKWYFQKLLAIIPFL
jgi:hypothetical protein